jgi:hypothetical protein
MTDELILKVEAYIAEVKQLRDLTDGLYKGILLHRDEVDGSVEFQIRSLLIALNDAVRYMSGVGL